MPTPRLRLGQLLVDARLISSESLDEVLAAQRSDGRRLGTLLVERGLINETQLTQILSHQLSVPWVSLLHIEFSRQLLNLVPREVADRFCLVPIYVRHVRNQGDTLYVAMDDPSNEDGLRACREHSGLPVRAMIAPPMDIRSAIRVYYGVEPPAAASPAVPAPIEPIREPAPEPVAAIAPSPEPAPGASAAEPVPAAASLEPAPVAASQEPAPPAAAAAPDVDTSAAEWAPPSIVDAPTVDAPPIEADAAPAVAAAPEDAPLPRPDPAADGPAIEAVEIPIDPRRVERLRGLLDPPLTPPPPSSPRVEDIPRPRGRAPRMVSLTLLDGTTINLPAKRRARRPAAGEEEPAAPRPATLTSEPPGSEDSVQGLTARDLVLALRVVANGADASEVLGSNMRWEALFSALLSLMLKKHLIADWEFIDELKKQV